MDTFQQNNQLLLFDEALMLLDDNPAQEEQQNEYAMVLDGANDVNEEKDNVLITLELESINTNDPKETRSMLESNRLKSDHKLKIKMSYP